MPHVFLPDSCMGCGACCFLQVHVFKPDQPALPAGTYYYDDEEKEYFLHQRSDRACVHLDPVEHTCAIYADRPEVCRDFERGTGKCFTAIHKLIEAEEEKARRPLRESREI